MKDSQGLNMWRDSPCSWIARVSFVKMPVLPSSIYRFSTIVIRILGGDVVNVNELIQKFKHKGK
jgi:hypothetical protein